VKTIALQIIGKQLHNIFLLRGIRGVTLILLFALFSCQSQEEKLPEFNAIQYVNPQIGAVHARWFFYTPAALPFGMAKLAPHTNAYESMGSWLPGGYDDRHNSIEGFGHFHEFQIGGVVVMPTVGEIKTTPGTLENPAEGYRSRFDKKDEHSEPGYYSVLLKDYNIKAEITATERVGFHRYTFPESGNSNLIFDIGHKQGESSDVTEAFAKEPQKKSPTFFRRSTSFFLVWQARHPFPVFPLETGRRLS